jgi:hypothetical protein
MARQAVAPRLRRQLERTRQQHKAIDAFASPQPNPSHLISASEDFTAVPGSLPPARSHPSRSHQHRGGRTGRLSPMPSARRPSVTFKLTHHRRVPPQTLTARHRNGDLWEPRGATLRTGPPVSHSSSKRFGVTTTTSLSTGEPAVRTPFPPAPSLQIVGIDVLQTGARKQPRNPRFDQFAAASGTLRYPPAGIAQRHRRVERFPAMHRASQRVPTFSRGICPGCSFCDRLIGEDTRTKTSTVQAS